jgi:iron complex outermembrane receptor protein
MDRADVGGLGQALAKTPQSVTVLGADLLAATATGSLSQAIKLDASLADSYNTTGYVEGLSVRGFLLDQGNNFLRNGLPVSNFAPIALENKERIEVLKGVSGLQSGVSAPGGLVNLVTKTPQRDAFTTV